jgi:coproporphyrinogen III oxidase-like Fe-S oxidoreductase
LGLFSPAKYITGTPATSLRGGQNANSIEEYIQHRRGEQQGFSPEQNVFRWSASIDCPSERHVYVHGPICGVSAAIMFVLLAPVAQGDVTATFPPSTEEKTRTRATTMCARTRIYLCGGTPSLLYARDIAALAARL